mmetsp:Transcript_17341/g.53842  ORF Transcript_17341/g.53842 Transcript_17341/m.53842 type:complete len:361 (+) Transcript_17341:3-1085(+)
MRKPCVGTGVDTAGGDGEGAAVAGALMPNGGGIGVELGPGMRKGDAAVAGCAAEVTALGALGCFLEKAHDCSTAITSGTAAIASAIGLDARPRTLVVSTAGCCGGAAGAVALAKGGGIGAGAFGGMRKPATGAGAAAAGGGAMAVEGLRSGVLEVGAMDTGGGRGVAALGGMEKTEPPVGAETGGGGCARIAGCVTGATLAGGAGGGSAMPKGGGIGVGERGGMRKPVADGAVAAGDGAVAGAGTTGMGGGAEKPIGGGMGVAGRGGIWKPWPAVERAGEEDTIGGGVLRGMGGGRGAPRAGSVKAFAGAAGALGAAVDDDVGGSGVERGGGMAKGDAAEVAGSDDGVAFAAADAGCTGG